MVAMTLNSLAWAQHVALCVERQLRETDDPAERRRLKALRDWHFAELDPEQIARKPQEA
jgi:hypothetical protein